MRKTTIYMNNSPIEVLSPAGSRESLYAAVRSGADAVYLGGKHYSARRNAENFSIGELEDAVKYCHIRGVKVYLTLNIMLREDELYDALEFVKQAAGSGIDGVIIADLGLLRLVHKAIPDLPLHASTQMTVMSPSALLPLKKLGITRVVVARELSLNAIKEICLEAKKLDMTVEVFVHGALCMSVSGQCLLSAMLGSRSGNRGLCAGPCRLPFGVEGGTGYDLSLKDLSLFSHINELIDIGVASLKIEGRMKRPEYVAVATSACRSAVDNGFVPENLSKLLRDVFSRSGFTDGYFTEKTGKAMFGTRTREDVVSASDAFPIIHEIYRNERQCVPINITATIKRGEPILLELKDTKNTVKVTGGIPETAKQRPTEFDSVKTNLSKLGGTPYYADTCDVYIDDNLFVPSSTINALRREAVEKLNDIRSSIIKYETFDILNNTEYDNSTKTPYLIARFESTEQLPENIENLDGVMLPLESEIPTNLPERLELIVDIPRGILSEKYIKNRLLEFSKNGFNYACCGNLAAVKIANELGFKIIGGTGLNAANSETVNALKNMGVDKITLSPELLLSDIVKLKTSTEKGIFAYGRLPLMLMRNCPAANGTECKTCNRNSVITDRKDISFPIKCRAGFSELYNSLPIWLADRLSECKGLDYLLLYFTDESQNDISNIIDMYKNGGAFKNKYTRGLYYRSVL
ncbi:MAG: U32 family peptidase [Ruminococcaceae bacterium]|nr:U32 family peptidase [Oscillospiraceae bacterium]